ncbi:hypothetical protein [Herbaspirillum huttiense]|jgi:hypothetical protein|uniref:hypothetical protein n=2 Tax=Herbaspirillum TaxID=963 RepID=UPI003385D365|nr:hypothetical protein [Herbaspirillum sp.]
MPVLNSHVLSSDGQPWFSIEVSSTHEAGARSFMEHLEGCIKRGEHFNDGNTVDMGWGRLKLIANKNGSLVVHEPSFSEFPIRWVPGANRTFSQLMVQRQLCAEIGVEPDFCSLMQAGLVSKVMLQRSGDFQMDRYTGDGKANSGWTFYEMGKVDASEVAWASLFQICLTYPQVAPFFGLPSESHIVYRRDLIEVSCAGRLIDSNSNEFLRSLLLSKNYGPTA